MTDGAAPSLWSRRDFWRIVVGQVSTQLGTDVTSIAFPLTAVLILHASPFELGLLVAIQNGAFLVVGLPTGVWLDRRRLRPTLIATDLVRCAALVSVAAMAALSQLTMGFLMAVAAVMSVMRVVFEIGYQSYLPTIVSREQLVQGNSTVEAVRASGQVAGSGLGGWLTQLLGAANALLIDAVSYLVSAVCLWTVRTREERPARTAERGVLHQAWEGVAYVLANPVLRAIAATSALSNLFFTAATALTILFLVETVGFRAGVAGMLLSAASAATLVGAALATPLARRVGSARIIWLSVAATGPVNLLIPLTEKDWRVVLFLIAVTVSGAGQIVYAITQVSYRQALVPKAILNRVNASMRFLVMGALPLGGLLGGALGSAVGVRPTLLAIGVGLALSPLPLVFSPLRRARDLEDLTPATTLARPARDAEQPIR
ncbi:MAG: MFS transporter [Micromonospora sp.]